MGVKFIDLAVTEINSNDEAKMAKEMQDLEKNSSWMSLVWVVHG